MSDSADATPSGDSTPDSTAKDSTAKDSAAKDSASQDATPKHKADTPARDDDNQGRKRWLLLLLLLLLILLLLCGGFAYMKWWRGDAAPGTDPSPSPTAVATTPAAPSTPSPEPTTASPSPTVATVAMPDVVGMQTEQGNKILEDLGFTSLKFVDGDGTELESLEGWVVVEQSVAEGEEIPVDTEILITSTASSNGKG